MTNRTDKFFLAFALFFSPAVLSLGCGQLHVDLPVTVLEKYGSGNGNDTIFKIILEGEDCAFAHRAEYGVYLPGGTDPLQGILILQHGCTMEQFGIPSGSIRQTRPKYPFCYVTRGPTTVRRTSSAGKPR